MAFGVELLGEVEMTKSWKAGAKDEFVGDDRVLMELLSVAEHATKNVSAVEVVETIGSVSVRRRIEF
jgi:hypothetical protein